VALKNRARMVPLLLGAIVCFHSLHTRISRKQIFAMVLRAGAKLTNLSKSDIDHYGTVLLGNPDLIDKVEVDPLSSIFTLGRTVGVVCVRGVCFSNSSRIAA
jgi:hypothetical protein